MIKVNVEDYTYGFDLHVIMTGLRSKLKCKFVREFNNGYWDVYLKDTAIESELVRALVK